MNNSLIYGKSDLTRVVSIEPRESDCEIFRELESGEVVSQIVPMKWYILFAEQLSTKFKRLEGNQFYKYIMEYDSETKYREVLSACYEKRYPLHVIRDRKESLMCRDGYTMYKGMKVEDVSVLSVDIEDTYGIGDTLRKDGKVLLIGNTFRKQGKITKKQFAIDDYPDEATMILAWALWLTHVNPSIIIGHNLYGHDLKVLDFAARKSGMRLNIGRDGSEMKIASRSSQFRKDGSQSYDYNNILIYGREIVDTWFLALKYDVAARREYESHGLKYIMQHEGLEKINRQHYDASTIAQNWMKPDEWKKIKAYNVDDADDPLKYFDLTIPSFFYYTQSVPRSLQAIINTATGSQINSLMVRAYLQQGHSVALASDRQDYEGAIAFGRPGIYRNVFKIDVQSLYPSIILSSRICNRDKDPQGLFLKLVDYFTQERIRNKELGATTGDRYYTDLSDGQKIACNSMYGFLGADKLNYNSPLDAAKVTEIGREILKTSMKWCDTHGFTIANCDTDSVAFSKADSKVFTEEEQTALLAEINSQMPEHIVWKNDKTFRRFIVMAGKNYVLDDGKKVKIKGSALKAPLKAPALRQFIRDVIDLLLADKKDQVLFLYLAKIREIQTLTDVNPWCFKATVSKKILEPGEDATFQKKILAALGDTPVSEGDKVYLFNLPDGSLCLREKYAGQIDKSKLYKSLRNTIEVFDSLFDVDLFPNLALKKNQKLLHSLTA